MQANDTRERRYRELHNACHWTCQAVTTAHILVNQVSKIEDAIVPARAGIEAANLGLYLSEAKALLARLEDDLACGPAPSAVGNIGGTSFHEQGFRISREVYLGILKAANWDLWLQRQSQWSVLHTEEMQVKDRQEVEAHWAAVKAYLRLEAPDFDAVALADQIRRESADRKRQYTQPRPSPLVVHVHGSTEESTNGGAAAPDDGEANGASDVKKSRPRRLPPSRTKAYAALDYATKNAAVSSLPEAYKWLCENPLPKQWHVKGFEGVDLENYSPPRKLTSFKAYVREAERHLRRIESPNAGRQKQDDSHGGYSPTTPYETEVTQPKRTKRRKKPDEIRAERIEKLHVIAGDLATADSPGQEMRLREAASSCLRQLEIDDPRVSGMIRGGDRRETAGKLSKLAELLKHQIR